MALWNRTLRIMYLGLAALGTSYFQFELQAMNRNNQMPFWRFRIWCSVQICKAKLTSNEREIDQNYDLASWCKLSWGASWLLPTPGAQGNGIMASWCVFCDCQLRLDAVLFRDVQWWEDLHWEFPDFPMRSIEILICHESQRSWQLSKIQRQEAFGLWHSSHCIHSLSTCHWDMSRTQHCAIYVPCPRGWGNVRNSQDIRKEWKDRTNTFEPLTFGFCLQLASTWAKCTWSGNHLRSQEDMLCRRARLCRGCGRRWHKLVLAYTV